MGGVAGREETGAGCGHGRGGAAAAGPAAEGLVPGGCALCLGVGGGLAAPLPALGDAEGAALPVGLPPVVDSHVHLFPPGVFEAIWRWFDQHGWPIRYQLHAEAVVDFLVGRGVERVVGLHYAHKPGMARALNRFVLELAARRPAVVPLATVFPGEVGAAGILAEAFAGGARGVKLHTHVMGLAIDDPAVMEALAVAAAHGRPVVCHAGREPRSPAYPADPWALCGAERVERVLREIPGLTLVVPHLGADEWGAYARLLERHAGLWLDTTMALAGYLPGAGEAPWGLLEVAPERILYGTDFPNLPYAWDRELRRILERRPSDARLEALLGGNARRLYGLG